MYLDFETEPIARARLIPPPVCVQWQDSAEVCIGVPSERQCGDWLERSEPMIGANTAFDMLVIGTAFPDLLPLVHAKYLRGEVLDVLLTRKLLDIAAGRYERIHSWSLAACAQRAQYPEKLDKLSWRTRFQELRGVPFEWWPVGATTYATDDVRATAWVDAWNRAEGDPGYHAVKAAQASLTLTRASAWGVLTSQDRTERLDKRVRDHIDEIKGPLVQLGLVRKDGTKNIAVATQYILQAWRDSGRPAMLAKEGEKQLRAAMRRGVPQAQAQAHLEDRGYGIALDKDACILCGDELMVIYSEYASQKLLLGRVERARAGWYLPLQTRFDPLKETARTSSTQPDEPLVGEQMQNFQRGKKDEALGLREVFEPRYGNLFLSADGAMAELHSLAHVCRVKFGFSRMGDMIDAGTDLHWFVAAHFAGITYEQIRQYAKDGTPCPFAGVSWDDLRTMSKAVNFGLPGGMGVDKLILSARKSYGVRISREDAVKLKQLWLELFPEMRLYFKWISEQGDGFTHVHPVTGFVRGDCGYCDGANQGFQHLTAYGAKDALFAVDLACFDPASALYGFRIWNFVHDEILLEGAASGCAAAAIELKSICEREFNKWCPSSPTQWDPVIAAVWSKKAKTVTDAAGVYKEWKAA